MKESIVKNLLQSLALSLLLSSTATGCDFDEAPSQNTQKKDKKDKQQPHKKNAVSWEDGGQFLSAFVQLEPLDCEGERPRIALSGELLTTGEAGSIELIVLADDFDGEEFILVEKKSFEEVDGMMQAPIDVVIPIPRADHTLRLCMYQRGAKGRSEQGACLPEIEVPLTCDRRTESTDLEAPQIVAKPDREPNDNGWYNASVKISFDCQDTDTGVLSCPEEQLLEEEGRDRGAWGESYDRAGNRSAIRFPARIDMTPPEIEFVGAREYLVDEKVDIGCKIGDPLSGVAESSCMASAGSAFLFELGAHSITASASDLAGNVAEARDEFSVNVDAASLCSLVERFVEEDAVARLLCRRLYRAEGALRQENDNALDSELAELHAKVNEERGSSVPDEFADTLRRFADGFEEFHIDR